MDELNAKVRKAPKVMMAMVSGDMVHADTMMAFATAVHDCEWPLSLLNARATYIQLGRRNAAQMALDNGADYLLFVDSDMIFPSNTITRLMMVMWALEEQGCVVTGATYSKRVPPFHLVSKELDGSWSKLTDDQRSAREVMALPTGLMLIDTRIFTQIKKPWFECPWNEEKGEFEGEDFFFCNAVRAVGGKIVLDEGLSHSVGHIGQKVHTVEGLNATQPPRASLIMPTPAERAAIVSRGPGPILQ